MPVQFEKWTRTGQTQRKETPQGQPLNSFVWRGRQGEEQVDVGGSIWAPYSYDSQARNVRAANGSELQLLATEQLIRFNGIDVVPEQRWFIEVRQGNSWDSQTKGLSVLEHFENEASDGTRRSEFGNILARLSHPAAQNFDFEVHYTQGRGARVDTAVLFRHTSGPQTREVRFVQRFRGIVHTTWRSIWAMEPFSRNPDTWLTKAEPGVPAVPTTDPLQAGLPGGRQNRVIGVEFGDDPGIAFRWTYAESPLRTVTVTPSTEFPGTLDCEILWGPYTAVRGEWLRIFPDSWGATNIQSNTDDVNQSDGATTVKLNGSFGNTLYLTGLYDGDDRYIGFRWTPDLGGGSISSIDTDEGGTIINLYNQGDNNSLGSFAGPTLSAVDSADTSTWSNSNRPDQATLTTANTSVTPTTGDQSPSVQSSVEELCVTDGNTYGGTEGMSFVIEDAPPDAGCYWSAAADYNAPGVADDTELAISYTPAAGGTSTPRGLSWIHDGVNPQRANTLNGELET